MTLLRGTQSPSCMPMVVSGASVGHCQKLQAETDPQIRQITPINGRRQEGESGNEKAEGRRRKGESKGQGRKAENGQRILSP